MNHILKSSESNSENFYLLSSLFHESGQFPEAVELLIKVDSLGKKDTEKSTPILPTSIEHIHCLYLITLGIHVKDYEMVLENIKKLLTDE